MIQSDDHHRHGIDTNGSVCSGRVQKQSRQHHGRWRPGRLHRGAPSGDEGGQEDVGRAEEQPGQKGIIVQAGRYALRGLYFGLCRCFTTQQISKGEEGREGRKYAVI